MPEKSGKAITVEQIRSANKLALESSQLGGYRVIVIHPAEAMNESASNALLKTLEEPAEKCCFILVTTQVSQLLPTILSRCQKMVIPAPEFTETLQWLEQQGYFNVRPYVIKLNNFAPLDVLSFIEQKREQQFNDLETLFLTFLESSAINLYPLVSLFKTESMMNLTWIWYSLADAQKIHFGIKPCDATPNSQAIADKVSYALIYNQLNALTILIHQLSSSTGLNDELLITNWLLDFIEDTCL